MFGRFRRSEEIVGYALSGGGSRAASQVGGLKALTEAGLWPRSIAGTSAGAVNATWFALYPHRLDRLEAIWLSLRTRDVFPGSRIRMLANMTKHGYIHQADAWEQFLRSHVDSARFEDCVIPCHVVAVRLSDGQRVLFDSGELVPAVMASTAIPGIFPPYEIDGELYVDGGVLEYLPVPTLLERGCTTIYALACCGFSGNAPLTSVVDRSALIGSLAETVRVCSLPASRGRTVHLLNPELPAIGDARNFHRTADLVALGYDHTRHYLEQRPSPSDATVTGPRQTG